MAKNKDAKKVIIGLPVAESLNIKTALSLMYAFKTAKVPVGVVIERSCDIIGNRNRLVMKAKELGATHLLFIDHDMNFPTREENPIDRLVSHDKDIVGAWYNFRTRGVENPEPVGSPLGEVSKTDLFKCNVVGTGFLLTKMSVFDKIPQPWFQFGRKADWTLAYGEDTWFCQQAIKHGFDVWADPLLEIGHIGEHIY